MSETNKILKLWMPIVKKEVNGNTKISAILSDDSLDLDDEMMSKSLIKEWALKKSLPALTDHKNSMENYHADWENIHYEDIGENGALVADPKTFSTIRGKQLAIQLREGKNCGVSISAIPYGHEMIEKSCNDGVVRKIKVYTKAKIVEASFIPVASNTHARAMRIAKSFNVENEVENVSKKEEYIGVSKKKEVKNMEDLEKMKIENEKLSKELQILKEEKETAELAKSKELELVKAKEVEALKKSNEEMKKQLSLKNPVKKELEAKDDEEEETDDNITEDKGFSFKDQIKKEYKRCYGDGKQ